MARSWARRGLWSVCALLGLWLLAWLVVPPLARTQIERQASAALGRKVTVAQVEFLPWSLEVTVRDLEIASQDGAATQFKLQRLYINAALQSLWRWAPIIDALELDGPQLHVVQTGPGHFDLDDVLQRLAKKPDASKADAPLPRFALYNISISDGAVTLNDRTVGKTHRLEHLRLDVPFLSNLAADRQVWVKPRLALVLNGSVFDSQAQATPFAANHGVQAGLQVHHLDLAPYAAYIAAYTPLKLHSGVLSADLRFEFSQLPKPQLHIRGDVGLDKVQLTDASSDASLLDIGRLHVVIKDVQPLDRVVELASLELSAPHVWMRRDASGSLQIPGGSTATAVNQPAKKTTVAPWQVRLAHLQLSDGTVDWQDASVPGGATRWTAERLQLQASEIAWPMDRPLRLRASTRVAGAGVTEAAQLAVQGEMTAQQAKLALSVHALPLALANPYLAGWLKPSLGGVLNADVGLARNGSAMVAEVAALSIDKLSLNCAGASNCRTLRRVGMPDTAAASLQEVGKLELADATVWLQQRRVALGRVSLQQPRLQLERTAQGRFMFEDWLRSGTAPSDPTVNDQPWALRLNELQIDGATLAWRDAMAVRPVALDLQGLKATIGHLDWRDGRLPAIALTLDTRVAAGRAEPGRLRLDGSLALMPEPEFEAKVNAQRLPLHALEPYVAEQLNVDIVRADGGFAGEVQFSGLQGGSKVRVQGDASLDDLRVLAGARQEADTQEAADTEQRVGERGEELLAGKSLRLRGVDVQLDPGKPLLLQVQETALSDFFARLIVQEDGRLNLQSIRKAPTPTSRPQDLVPAPDGQPTVSVALAPVMRFGPVTLSNGAVRFTDHFIKPNYSADLSSLSGRLGAFSSVPPTGSASPQMAELELKGRAQTTAMLEISGQLNPLAQPLALDIQAKMRDLELPPLSPYSVKYAGHSIEQGKLSMDVSYKVQPDGKLAANNKLVLNQLAFGDQVEGAPASLPVRLAVALLADRNGVIDLDLPISGSLNDPQFSLGSVIVKVIGNLIMKAVTAPFSLLAGVFTGADEHGAIDFAPGNAALGDGARRQLDKIAKALADKPALKVTVIGWADAQTELQAYKLGLLHTQVEAQKRKQALRAGAPADTVTGVSAEEYPALLKEVYRSADIKKPRNLIGMAKDLSQAEMEALLLQAMPLPPDAMNTLALARSTAVRDYLAERGVDVQRIFIGASKLHAADEKSEAWTPRVQMNLTMR